MKRLGLILERSGTTLIAISLAFLLVSVVPQPQYSQSSGSGSMYPGNFGSAFTHQNLTPQDQLEITVSVNGTIKVYLLDVCTPSQPVSSGDGDFNVSQIEESVKELQRMIQEILDGQPDKIIWEYEVTSGTFSRTYIPTKIINATVVTYNPTSEIVNVEHSVSLTSSLAPAEKSQTIACILAPTGILLALPWLLDSWKQRKHK